MKTISKSYKSLFGIVLFGTLLLFWFSAPKAFGVTSTYIIATTQDDTYCRTYGTTTENNYSATTTLSGRWNNINAMGYFRWAIPDIPKGSHISSAVISVNAENNGTGNPGLTIYLIDTANCPRFDIAAPVTIPNNPTSVGWTPPTFVSGTWYTTSTITTLLQIYVNKPDYTPGNYIGLKIGFAGGGTDRYRVVRQFDYDTTTTYSARLVVTFNLPPNAVNLLSPVDQSSSTNHLPTFIWNPAIDPDGETPQYLVQVATDTFFNTFEYQTTVSDITEATPLIEFTTGAHYWRVISQDTPWFAQSTSVAWKFTCLNRPPDAATLLSPINESSTFSHTPTFTWSSTADPDGDIVTYWIQVATDSDFNNMEWQSPFPSTDTTATSGIELANGLYYWRIKTFDTSFEENTSAAWTVTIVNPPPTLSSIDPTSGNRLETLPVVLTGTNYVDGVSSVDFGPNIQINSTTVDNDSTITVNITIRSTADTSPRDVTVTNAGPLGGGTATLTGAFTVNNPAPALSNIAPTSGNRLQTLPVVLTGANYIEGVSSVNFGAGITVNSIVVCNNFSEITANITIDALAPTGPHNVTVSNDIPGGGTATLTGGFTVDNPLPTIGNIAPGSGKRLETLEVVFYGTNYISGVSSVDFGADIQINSTTVTDDSTLTANITILATATAGARSVTVSNPAPGGGTSSAVGFEVNNPAPTLASIAPTSGNRLQTLPVVLTGTNYISGVSSTYFGPDITVNSTTVDNDSTITVSITIDTAAATGTRDVTVTNPAPSGGTATLTGGFTVDNPAPTLASIDPTSGNRLETLNVVFHGTNYVNGASSVDFGPNIQINSTTVDNDSTITVEITIRSTADTSTRNVSVTNPGPFGGGTATLTDGFTVNNPAPTLSSIVPNNGDRGQSFDVVFQGTKYIDGVSTVDFGSGITVNSIVVDLDTAITANITIDAGATPGARDVSVNNATPGGGTATLTNGFTVENRSPNVASLLTPLNGSTSADRTPLFSWNTSTDPDGDPVVYMLEVDNNSDFSSPEFSPGFSSGTEATPGTDLAIGTYSWRVISQDNLFASATSVVWTVMIGNQPPAAVSLLTPIDGSTTTNRSLTFFWNIAADPEGNPVEYRIQVDKNSNFSSPEYNGSFSSETEAIPSSPLSPDKYYWRVISIDLGLAENTSTVWTVTIENQTPLAVSLLTPLNNSTTTNRKPSFSWNTAPDPDGDEVVYQLQVDNNNNFASPEYTFGFDSITHATSDVWLTPEPYYWRVISQDSFNAQNTSATQILNIEPSATSTPMFVPLDNKHSYIIEQSFDVDINRKE